METWRLQRLAGWAGAEWHTDLLPWADMANQSQHSLLLSWGGNLGREAATYPGRGFAKEEWGKAACHDHQPLEVEVGFKPSSDSRASGSWKLVVQGLRARVEFCHSASSAPAKAPAAPLGTGAVWSGHALSKPVNLYWLQPVCARCNGLIAAGAYILGS